MTAQDDTDADAADSGDAADPVEAPRPARTVPAGAFVAAVMAAAVLGIIALVALSLGSGDGNGEADDARLAAGRFAERFLTFDHTEVDEWKADVLALSTGAFAEEVEKSEEGLRRITEEAERVIEAQVTDVFVGEVDRGAVSVVLVYDLERRDVEGVRRETDRYMQLSLLRVDGEWLVDKAIDIATAGGLEGTAPAPPEPPSETTTTAGG